MLVDTISKVNNITFDSTNLSAYVTSLRGLSETQARVVLSSTSLDKVQKQQILNKIAETNATVSLTSAEATEALTRSLGSKEAANELLVKSGLVTEEQLLAGTTIEVTSAKIADAVATGVLTKEEGLKISTALGLTGANIGLGTSFKLLAKSIWQATVAMVKWLFLTPAGWATLAITAIVGATAAYIKWGDTLDNTREKLADLKSEYDTVTSDIESVNGELETTKKRISELENKGKLTFTEKEELDNLIKQNNELQRTIDLLKLEQDEKQKEKNKTFVSAMEKDVEQHDEYHVSSYSGKVEKGHGGRDIGMGTNEKAYINQQFRDYQENLRQISELNEQYKDDLSNKEYQKEKKRLEDKNKKISKYINDKNKEFTTDAEGIDYIQNPTTEDDKKVNEWLDYINDFQDKMAVAMGGENAKENAFNRLVDNWKFDEALNPLQKLGKEGKVTLDELKKRMSDPVFAEFVDKLVEIGVISDTTDGSLRYLANAFNGTATSARNYVTALKGNDLNNFIKNLDEEAKALGTTESELAKLTAAHVIFNNTGLSTEQQQQALQMLAAKIATTSAEMKYLLQLFNYASGNFDAAGASTMTEQERRARTVRSKQYLKDKYGIDLSPIKIPEKEDTPPYTPSGGDDKGSSKDNTPDYEDPTEAIINRINLRSKELEQQEEQIENAIEIAELENDYKKQISLTNDLIDTRKQRIDELNKANAKFHNEAEYLRNSNPYNEASWFDSQGNATEAYYADLNKKNITKEEKERIKDLFEKIQKYKQAWVENDKIIKDLEKENIKSTENKSDIASEELTNYFEERNEISERWIQTQTDFDQLTIQGQIEAYARMVRNNKGFLKQIEQNEYLSAEERDKLRKKYSDKIVDYQLEAYNLVKEAMQQYADDIESGYDLRISRLNSESSLLSTYYNLINAINEEQHNLNKELAEAEVAGAKMNEIERQTLFTKQEHTTLSSKLNKIMNEAKVLQSDYLDDLETATEDTIEEITNNYERQYELKMKEYEVVKAELELVKAQQKLENVENEKSVRTWNGTKWVYEANFQDVVDAKLAVEDAKYAVMQAKTEQKQQNALNAINSTADSLETQKNLFAKSLEKLSGDTKITGKQLTDALKYIAEVDLPTFDKIVGQFGDSLADVFDIDVDKIRNSSKSKVSHLTYSSTVAQMRARSEKWASASQDERNSLHAQNKKDAEKIGASYDSSTGTWTDKLGNRLYANGSKSTTPGLGMFDETGIGSEYVLTKDGILHNFNMGDKVFNQSMGDNLYEAAQIDWKKFSINDFGGLSSTDNSIRNMSNNTYYSVNGVNINSEEGGEIKGFVKFLKAKKI